MRQATSGGQAVPYYFQLISQTGRPICGLDALGRCSGLPGSSGARCMSCASTVISLGACIEAVFFRYVLEDATYRQLVHLGAWGIIRSASPLPLRCDGVSIVFWGLDSLPKKPAHAAGRV